MKLDETEQQLLLLLADENTLEEMAAKLGLSERKVNKIFQNMLQKFEVKSEVGLIKEAITKGLIDNE